MFSGRFGSGKTEVAINFALAWAAQSAGPASPPPALIDLDIVTPYFRSREMAEPMCARGVEVITPAPLARHLDTPGITPQILGALQRPEGKVVLDVGGDEQGARALGQYSAALRERGYAMYLVVNPFRPWTSDTAGIRDAIGSIERTSRLLVTGLVSNPNLMADTTAELWQAGERTVELAGRQLGMPVVFATVERDLLEQAGPAIATETPILILERFFVLPWA